MSEHMKNISINIHAGGIFSKYITGLQNILIIDKNCDNVYLKNIDPRFIKEPNHNAFDYILEQTMDDSYESYEASHDYPQYDNRNPVEACENFNSLREIVKKIKIKDSILNKVKSLSDELNINNKTLGIHVRLTDMNIHHPQYGVLHSDDYIKIIDQIHHNYDNIFVASDNIESIEKLKNRFDNKISFVKDMIRGSTETQNTFSLWLKHGKDERIWEEIFIEMLLLSKCGSLVCRTSNVNNITLLYADQNIGITRV